MSLQQPYDSFNNLGPVFADGQPTQTHTEIRATFHARLDEMLDAMFSNMPNLVNEDGTPNIDYYACLDQVVANENSLREFAVAMQ